MKVEHLQNLVPKEIIGTVISDIFILRNLYPNFRNQLFSILAPLPINARRYLNGLPKKTPIPLSQKFPKADPMALRLLEKLIAFDPADRISAEEALADPYFYGLANLETEPSKQPISKLEFEFERRRLTKNDVRELIYREILEYHPQMLQEYLHGEEHISFMYPSGIDRFKEKFADLEEQEGKEGKNSPLQRHYTSLPRERICVPTEEAVDEINDFERRTNAAIATTLKSPPRSERCNITKTPKKDSNIIPTCCKYRDLARSSSISTPKYVGANNRSCKETLEQGDEASGVLSQKLAALSS